MHICNCSQFPPALTPVQNLLLTEAVADSRALFRTGNLARFLLRKALVCRFVAFRQTKRGPETDGSKMLTALILICSLASVSDVGACTEDNALEVLRSPEAFASPVTCLMHGQAYLANTAMGRDLNAKVKVICVRSKIGATPASDKSNVDMVGDFSTRR